MKRSEKTIGPYLVLLTIGLSWNAIWWLLVTPEGYPKVASKPSLAVQYFPLDSDRGSVGLDPSIFSLPSHVGFSRDVLSSRDSVLPPLDFEKSLSIFMNRSVALESDELDLEVGSFSEVLMQRIKKGSFVRPVEQSSSMSASDAIEPRITWRLDGAISELAELNEWVSSLVDITNTSWSIQLEINVDSLGYVDHVFIDKGTGDSALDGELRTSLNALHFKPQAEVDHVRLWIKNVAREGEAQ